MQAQPEPSASTATGSSALPVAGYTVEKPEAVLFTSQQPPPPPAYAPPSYQPPATVYGFGPSASVSPAQYGAPSGYGFAPATYGYPSGPSAPQPWLQNSQNVQVNITGATVSPPVIIAQPAPIVQSPPSYLGWSIFNCLCCFWPLGLAAIVYSVKVGGAKNYGEAKSHSITARNLNIAASTIAPILAIVVVGAAVGSVVTGGGSVATSGGSYRPSYSASVSYYSYGYDYYYTYLMYYTSYLSYSYTTYSSIGVYKYSYVTTLYRSVTASKYVVDNYYQYAQKAYYYSYG